MLYLSKADGEKFNFPMDYRQTFHHESRKSFTSMEYTTIRIVFDAMTDDQREISLIVLEHLANFRFATESQLRRLIGAKGQSDNQDMIYDLLADFVDQKILNYFIITSGEEMFSQESIPVDALKIYCLDYGAQQILSHYSYSPYTRWTPGDERRVSQLVARHIMTAEFYLQVLILRQETLENFVPNKDFTNGKRGIRFSAGFRIMQSCTGIEFLFDVVRENDITKSWPDELDKMIPFIRDKYMKRYYEGGNPEGNFSSPPLFIFMVETPEIAGRVAVDFFRATGYDSFYILLERDMLKGLQNAPLYTYDRAEGKLKGRRENFFQSVAGFQKPVASK